ncbi:MAG: ATP synthase F1 subunit delta [Planctomycetes bacterium]|nr:ATP synthase F1 subunit delta [Planctomycetota bacterium]
MESASKIGRIYAEALFELAKTDGKIGECYDNLDELHKIYRNEKEFRDFFTSPTIDRDQKIMIVSEIFDGSVETLVLNLLCILIRKHRETALNNIYEAYMKYRDEDVNRVYAKVITAKKMKDEVLDRLKSELTEKLQKNVFIEEKLNEKIIGGMIVRIGDNVINSSIINKLRNLRQNFKTFESQ